MKRALQILIAGTLAFWLAVSFPAYRLGGEVSLVTAALAALLCLLPTTGTLLWAGWAQDQAPAQQMVVLLGGTGVRMAVVLGAGLLISPFYPAAIVGPLRELFGLLGHANWTPANEPTLLTWWGWLLAFYLLTLALEIGILVAGQKSAIEPRT